MAPADKREKNETKKRRKKKREKRSKREKEKTKENGGNDGVHLLEHKDGIHMKRKKIMPAGFSKVEGEEEAGTQELLTPECIPASPCPSDQSF